MYATLARDLEVYLRDFLALRPVWIGDIASFDDIIRKTFDSNEPRLDLEELIRAVEDLLREVKDDPNKIAHILEIRRDHKGAMRRYEESLEIAKEQGDRAGMARCYVRMGVVYERLAIPTKALEMYRSGLALTRELGLPVPEWLPRKIKDLGG